MLIWDDVKPLPKSLVHRETALSCGTSLTGSSGSGAAAGAQTRVECGDHTDRRAEPAGAVGCPSPRRNRQIIPETEITSKGRSERDNSWKRSGRCRQQCCSATWCWSIVPAPLLLPSLQPRREPAPSASLASTASKPGHALTTEL